MAMPEKTTVSRVRYFIMMDWVTVAKKLIEIKI
jgi:hypothetical protein